MVRQIAHDSARLGGADGATLGCIGLQDGVWFVRREVPATGSGWAVPAAVEAPRR